MSPVREMKDGRGKCIFYGSLPLETGGLTPMSFRLPCKLTIQHYMLTLWCLAKSFILKLKWIIFTPNDISNIVYLIVLGTLEWLCNGVHVVFMNACFSTDWEWEWVYLCCECQWAIWVGHSSCWELYILLHCLKRFYFYLCTCKWV